MHNTIEVRCPACGMAAKVTVEERAGEHDPVPCPACGARLALAGELQARIAQQALGLGATELRDDHVPVGGAFGEQPGI